MGADPVEVKGSGRVVLKPPGSIPKGSSSTKEQHRAGHGGPRTAQGPRCRIPNSRCNSGLESSQSLLGPPPIPNNIISEQIQLYSPNSREVEKKKKLPIVG